MQSNPSMKTQLVFTALLLSFFSFSQPSTSTFLTWMKGDNAISQPGIYGVKGIPDSSNKPGARNFATTWRDSHGNLWMYGGSGYHTTAQGYLNDLWKYEPLTNRWTWMEGDYSGDQPGIYGHRGIAATENKPGANYASVSWTDANGNLWMFGGFGYTADDFGFLNALWKYNTVTGEWTWMHGDNQIDATGSYGTRGIPAAGNKPGSRYGSRTWTDKEGNLWLFGGFGYDHTDMGTLNDLWRFSPLSNEWTWINGDSTINQFGRYGQKGTYHPANQPGARYVSTSWIDSTGNFFLFGGYGNGNGGEGLLNDLWKYNVNTNEWMWIEGDSSIEMKGHYTTQGIPDDISQPGARNISMSWTDEQDNLWLFGGFGYDESTTGYLNDLWKYTPSTGKWTWVKGDNIVDQFADYGMRGMPTVTNKTGARTSSISWTDDMGQLWLFGGYGYDANTNGLLNDLWKINSFHVLPVRLSSFHGRLQVEIACLNWQTAEESGLSHFRVQRSFDGHNFTDIGKVEPSLNAGRGTYTFEDHTLQGMTFSSVYYRLLTRDMNNTESYSKTIILDPVKGNNHGLQVFPNPASGSLTIAFTQLSEQGSTITIRDMKGAIVQTLTAKAGPGRVNTDTDISRLPAGTYVVTVADGNMVSTQKIVRQ